MNNTNAKLLKTTIVPPNKYSAWPLIGSIKGKPICIYTVADQHVATESLLYMKSSLVANQAKNSLNARK